MNTRKQSFLERLTGVAIVEDDLSSPRTPSENENVKRWSQNVHDEDPAEIADQGGENLNTENEQPEEEEESEAGIAIDMYETDNELVIQSMIAGVTPENLHIAITRDMVTIEGKRTLPHGIPEEQYALRELYWGAFSREISLPFEIDTDGAEAVEKYGLLIIRLPKLDKGRTQELKVKSV